MSVSDTGENKGIVSQIGDKMGGTLDKLLSLPDRPQHPVAKKVARIAADLLIVGLGVGIFWITTRFNLSTLANPSLTTLMSMPMCFALGGVGFAWLLEDMIGEKHRRTAGRIMAIITPILIVAGGACLIAAGFHSGVTQVTMGSYWFLGLLILPLSLFALDRAVDKLSRKEAKFVRRTAPNVFEMQERSRLRREEMVRLAESRELHRNPPPVTNRDLPPNPFYDGSL